ncbi:MAG: hypothetical protein ACPG4T_17215 [Nannocystaceae bacterium]
MRVSVTSIMNVRRRNKVALSYFAAVTLALIWPIYPWLGNHVEPRVMGLPWSLFYVLAWILANTGVLVVLYRTEPPEPSDVGSAGEGS